MTEQDMDWSVLDIEGVKRTTASAARKVVQQYATADASDLEQEGLIILASKAEEVRAVIEKGGLNLLHHWLWCDLTNLANGDARKVSKNFSFEEGHERHYQSEGMSGEQSRDIYFAERNTKMEEAREAAFRVAE